MELEYTVVRSPKRRKLTITVERDRRVVVRAPADTAAATIHRIVAAKRQWIIEKIRHPQKYRHPLPPPGKELINGESVLYLGREYRIELVDDADEIRFEQRFLVPRRHASSSAELFRDWYISRAEETILPCAQYYARRLGVDYATATVVASSRYWGACTVGNQLRFNWRLIKAPQWVIDYVVVHELAHLIEANHTPRFWNIIDAQITNAARARAWLKRHGELLEQEL